MSTARLNNYLFARHTDDDEEVVMILHKHWLIGVKELFWPTASFLLVLSFLYMAPFRLVVYGSFVASVACVVWWLRNFFDYFLDAWIVTDQGIVDVAWHGWFHRQSTRVLYSDIQGVSYEVEGVLSTVLRLGQISVEKISTGNSLSICHIKNPRAVEKMILKKMEEYLHGKNMHDSRHVQELLSELVAREMKLRDDFEEGEDDDDDDRWDDDDDEWDDDDDE